MKKVIRIIVAIAVVCIVLGIIVSIFKSCSENDPPSPDKPTVIEENFYLYANDGTETIHTISTSTIALTASYTFRTGYTFNGVYSSPEGGIQYYNSEGTQTSKPQKDAYLYMRWTINSYNLVFISESINIYSISDIEYGSSLPIFPIPSTVPKGKLFEGWRDATGNLISDSNGIPIGNKLNSGYIYGNSNKDITFTASFKDIMYTITYVYGEEIRPNSKIEVSAGSKLHLPSVDLSDKEGYKFVGWSYKNSATDPKYYNNEEINSDTTLYAIFVQYKDIYFMNGDKLLHTERIFDDGGSIILKDMEIELDEGYEIIGFYSNQSMSGSSRVTAITYALQYTTYYVDVKPINYTITLILGEGESSAVSTVSYNIENGATLPAASKQNHEFIGWCADEELETAPVTKIDPGKFGNFSLYPKFKGVDVKLTLDARNNETNGRITVEYGKEYKLNVPKYSGYVFIGWFDAITDGTRLTDKEGNSLAPLSIGNDTVLYAHWAKKYFVTVTVTPPSAGKVTVADYYLEGDTVSLSFLTPLGYDMVGWFVNEESVETDENYSFTMPSSNVDITLKLIPEEYTVTLDCVGYDIDGKSVTVVFGEMFEFPVLEKPAYTFLGWQYESSIITDNQGKSKDKWNITKSITIIPIFAQLDDSNGILIYDTATLLAVAKNTSATYQLVYDVDMTGEEWTPFAFSGKIIGNNHTIKNLTVSPVSVGHTGVFSTLGGTVENVNFENLNVTLTATDYTNNYAVGGVCGVLNGGTLSGVTVRGEIVGGTVFNYAGGLVGSMTGGTISNCKNYATVTGTCDSGTAGIVARFSGGTINDNENHGAVTGKNNVGGLFGLINVAGNYTIKNLSNEGNIIGENYVGGVLGYVNDYISVDMSNNPTYTLTLTNLSNNGNVTGADFIGGITGYLRANADNRYSSSRYANMKLAAAYLTNTGNITGKSRVGGLLGYCYSNDSSSTLSNGVSNGTIEGEYYIGGLTGKIEYVKMVDCSNENTVINATGYFLNTDNGVYYAYVGGYAGYGYSFENCENSTVITYNNRGIYVGGIVGYANGTIKNCTNTSNIKATNSDYVGGLAGYVTVSGNYTFITLTNSGEINGKNYTGGIFGYVNDYISVDMSSNPTYTLTLTNLSNNGNVTGADFIGGITGYLRANADNRYSSSRYANMKLAAAYLTNIGNITGKSRVGGLVGSGNSNDSSSTLSNGVSSGTIEGEYYIGGLAGYIASVKIIDCSNANTIIKATGFYLDGTTRRGYIGGYAGYGYSFENCENTVNITYTFGGNDVGGIAGHAEFIITNCKNTGNVIADSSCYVGGIVGFFNLSGTQTLSELTNSGEIRGKDYVGGIFGALNDTISVDMSSNPTYTLTLTKLNNSGKVTGTANIGGLIGNVYANADNRYSSSRYANMRLAASFLNNSGNVTAASNAGGLMGYATTNDSSSTIMEYTQTGTVTGTGENVDNLIGYKSNISYID